MAKIFLDPGHGGNDPGAVGKKSKEKDNVLKVAKKLKTLLEGYGHTVRLSRSTDKFISLSERARKANSWGADYFISLHNNAASSTATGFETFIYSGSVSDKTKHLQSAVHNAIAKSIGIRDRGKKRANFAVIRETKMPAVLIEYAFISNTGDESILINQVNKLANLTADGIVDIAGGKITAKPSKPQTGSSTTSKGLKWVGTDLKGRRVESIYRGKEGLNYYNGPRWNNPSGTFNYGQGWIIDNKYLVDGSAMYRVQNSKGQLFWITASSKYVKVK